MNTFVIPPLKSRVSPSSRSPLYVGGAWIDGAGSHHGHLQGCGSSEWPTEAEEGCATIGARLMRMTRMMRHVGGRRMIRMLRRRRRTKSFEMLSMTNCCNGPHAQSSPSPKDRHHITSHASSLHRRRGPSSPTFTHTHPPHRADAWLMDFFS